MTKEILKSVKKSAQNRKNKNKFLKLLSVFDYDELIISKQRLNNILDVVAKYSFGLFFVHWYWFFIYNQIFGLEKVVPIINGNYTLVLGTVILRFLIVTIFSMLSLFVGKKIILFINKNANVRMFLGV